MRNAPSLPYADAFVDALERDEKVLWVGQPRRGFILQPRDAMMIPFSILWCGFAIFWEATVLGVFGFGGNRSGGGAPLFFKLWGLPFVAVGLYMVIGRFFHDAWRRGRTYYAVTDRRALIVRKLFSTQVTSIALNALPTIHRTTFRSGYGTLQFGDTLPSRNARRGFNLPTQTAAAAFESILDAKAVEELIHEQARAIRTEI